MDTIKRNIDVEGNTWLLKLNNDYYPIDIGFDPFDCKPTDATEFTELQNKEPHHGLLTMIDDLCSLCLLQEYIILFITSSSYRKFYVLPPPISQTLSSPPPPAPLTTVGTTNVTSYINPLTGPLRTTDTNTAKR